MRVLHVHSGNLFGGVETLMLTLTKHERLNHAVEHQYALCFEGQFADELKAVGAPTHKLGEVRVRHPLSVWQARQVLGNLLRLEKFDLAVCHSSWSQAVFAKVVRKAGLPLVLWLHGVPADHNWLERWAGKSPPDMAICNSQYTEGLFDQRHSGVQTEVIYCPVSSHDGVLSKGDQMQARADLDTPGDATVIIQVSRMEKWKGHDIHLKALGLLREQPDWICWFVGGAQRLEEEEYVAELKQTALDLGIESRVRFLGQRTDVPKLLAAADIFCQPNLYAEPFGIAFVEALYAQKPVIATSVGGPTEIVDQSCGFLVPPNDAQAVATALRLLIDNRSLRNRLGANGPMRARALCDVSSQIDKLNNCLGRVSRNHLLAARA